MTREKTQGGAPTPPRAEPIQPDRPGRGTDRDEPDGGSAAGDGDHQAKRQAEQEKAALDNVRSGYR